MFCAVATLGASKSRTEAHDLSILAIRDYPEWTDNGPDERVQEKGAYYVRKRRKRRDTRQDAEGRDVAVEEEDAERDAQLF